MIFAFFLVSGIAITRGESPLNIEGDDSGTCGENLVYNFTYADKVLRISGSGNMSNYADTQAPWEEYRDSIKSVVLDDEVTSVGQNAFVMCYFLSTVTLGTKVASIDKTAFAYCSRLTGVTIPASVKYIGQRAFLYCAGLAALDMPGVTTIDSYAFAYTGVSQVSFTSLVHLGDYAFISCTRLTTISIPQSVTEIKEMAFSGCCNLTGELRIPAVKQIGTYAFCDCIMLTKIVIGDGVTSIGNCAFYNCNGVTSVDIGKNTATIGMLAFYNCTRLAGTVTIGDSVTSIGEGAFYRCFNIKEVHIGSSTTVISDRAFTYCTSMTEVVISSGNKAYKSVNGTIFQDPIFVFCPAGKTGAFTIPDSVTTIHRYAFYECVHLTSITIQNGVEIIENDAFFHCASLREIVLPGSMKRIESNAFDRCHSLVEVTIPKSVTFVDPTTFFVCLNMTTINVHPENAFYKSIDGVIFTKTGEILHKYPCGKQGSYIIPDSVSEIAEYGFYEAERLHSVVIPKSVTRIGTYAFGHCYSLADVRYEGECDPGADSTNVFKEAPLNTVVVMDYYDNEIFCGENITRVISTRTILIAVSSSILGVTLVTGLIVWYCRKKRNDWYEKHIRDGFMLVL